MLIITIVISLPLHHYHNQPYEGSYVSWTGVFAITEEVSLN